MTHLADLAQPAARPGGWTTPQAAAILGVSDYQLRWLEMTGRLCPYRDSCGVFWWTRDDLLAAAEIFAARKGSKRGRRPTCR